MAVLALLLAFWAPGAARALVWEGSLVGTDLLLLEARGPIVEGDAARLRDVLRRHPERQVRLSISSGGGLVLEAKEIARLIVARRIAVEIPAGERCASACFLLLAASPRPSAGAGAMVGVHSAARLDGRETALSQATTVQVARFAREPGVPEAIVGRIVATGPEAMGWLSPEELRAMGVALDGTAGPSPVDGAPGWIEGFLREAQVPDELAEGEPPAFVDGLRLRLGLQAWLQTLPDDVWFVALQAFHQASDGMLPRCETEPAEITRRLCASGLVWWREFSRRRALDPEIMRGWNALPDPLYATALLSEVRDCRRRGGRPRQERGLETRRDLNGDIMEDLVVDFAALVCSAGPGPACAGRACLIDLYLSGRDGLRLGYSGQVAGWTIRPGRPSLLEVEPAACAGRAGCREVWRIEGDRTFPAPR